MEPPWENFAEWIWHPRFDDSRNPGSIVLFRREFEISEDATSVTINVSADSRYRLFLNGQSISVGPCKGTPLHWYYETVDATPFVRKGRNVLAAQVLRYSNNYRGNTSIMRASIPGFILLTKGTKFRVATNEEWLCTEDASVSFITDSPLDSFLATDERIDGRSRMFGWETLGFDDSEWVRATLAPEDSPTRELPTTPWNLYERPISHLTEVPKRFSGVLKLGGPGTDDVSGTIAKWNAMLQVAAPLEVPPHTDITVDIAAAEYSTGYPRFVFAGGRHSSVQHLYAESYTEEAAPDNPDRTWVPAKGNRTDFRNGYLNGIWNTYIVAGRDVEVYEPFWFRAFRFVRLKIQTREEALIISEFSYRETNYPLEILATFNAPTSPLFSRFWEVSIRTLKNCMHETYEDCPFYEQSQFGFDTRTQMMLTYRISVDDRLARKALHDFHTSLRPDGLISMRYPAHTNVVLPGFSLFYPMMVHDHVLYRGDRVLARRYFPTVDAILDHFDRQLTSTGLVGQFNLRHWSYVDWVKDWHLGVPHAARCGPGTYFSLTYAMALESAAQVAEYIGRPSLAKEYLVRKAALLHAVNSQCFNGQWFFDGPITDKVLPPRNWRSQHCQVYAIISGAIDGEKAKDLMRRTLEDESLHKMSLSQSFYLFRALEKTRLYELAARQWKTWQSMLDQNLDTWPEELERPRSDCHAWSAVPLYEISAVILGVQPREPGFAAATVVPRVDMLDEANGSVMTPRGPIRVRWKPITSVEDGRTKTSVHLTIDAPTGMDIAFSLPGQGDVSIFQGHYETEVAL